MSNELRSEFLELAKFCEELEEKLKENKAKLAEKMSLLSLSQQIYVQDPETSTVYKIVKPKGTFVFYKEIDYVRTAIGDERAGTLSKKEAEAAGFVLKKS